MMELEEFKKYGHAMVDWMAEYYQNIESYPVKSQTKPGEILKQLPDSPPQQSESMDSILSDFNSIIMPGITHWQSPNFHAYFPANASFPSLLAEMLTAGLAAQCMIWDTSPAAAELEEKTMDWLKEMTGLPVAWSGVIQDGASNATLTAILSAREKYSDYKINEAGLKAAPQFRVYCSTETHSSIEKSVKIAGIGRENLVKIQVDDLLQMNSSVLEKAIISDIAEGFHPLCVVAAIGTTGTTAIDPLKSIGEICKKYNIWLHVDAAYAGTALVLPEYRWMIDGIEEADSLVLNPHKWMFTHFDCTAYFVKDREALIRTFEILPEYLKTQSRGQVNDYRDWGIPMGRRFRALKLWFVIRNFGVEGIQQKLRHHIALAKEFESWVQAHPNFQITAPTTLNVVFFTYVPTPTGSHPPTPELLLANINADGRIFLTHTKVKGIYTLRMVIGQTYVERKHIEKAWKVILELANG